MLAAVAPSARTAEENVLHLGRRACGRGGRLGDDETAHRGAVGIVERAAEGLADGVRR